MPETYTPAERAVMDAEQHLRRLQRDYGQQVADAQHALAAAHRELARSRATETSSR